MMGDGEEFLLKWHDHHNSFFQLVEELVAREQLCDVTLSCGDVILNAHSLMLSVCSPYFRTLLSESQHKEKHHIIHLNGVSGKLMQQLLVYMYRGEISIAQEDLGPLIETARCLQIKGLALANSDLQDSQLARKRPASQPQPQLDPGKQPKERKLARKLSPDIIVPEICNLEAQTDNLVIEEDTHDEEMNESLLLDRSNYSANDDLNNKEGKSVNQQISLPMLPKPLSILKTAETRTYLSKLIWLGNGGKRPQYGNPETKPHWWPQHVLPWEEMKKMGGRKSQELSHINYTEILKQCLAAGYEYYGYDPTTYICAETSLASLGQGTDDENSKVNGDDLAGNSPERTDDKLKSECETSSPILDRIQGAIPGLHSPILPGSSLPASLLQSLTTASAQQSLAAATAMSSGQGILAAAATNGGSPIIVQQNSLMTSPGGSTLSTLSAGSNNNRSRKKSSPGLLPVSQDTPKQDPSIVCQ
eukprot:TRINITY_DN21291_c0_g1_i3.p1 TRINITY_DN21291_c0_g1~~TRINITY_DN21291_c0_g1_i3.p1  ORF type:complete len:475 (+),score=92.54 TRINITY_DN21291_c0_g1_i3:240-1664(+)